MTPILNDDWRASAACRVRIALHLLDMPDQAVPVDRPTDDHRAPTNRARNPQGLVSKLEIDGLTLPQSLAIIKYLDATRQSGFLPAGPGARAYVRTLSYAIAIELAPACSPSACSLSARNHAAHISSGTITADAWARHFIHPGPAAFDAMRTETVRFCHGDTIALADICLVPQIHNARRLGLDVSTYPRITAILAVLETIPTIAAAHPDRNRPATNT